MNAITVNASSPPFAPFSFFVEHKKCEGVTTKILNDITAELSLESKQLSFPYARILTSLTQGKLDLALIFKNQQVAQYVDYIGPISKSKVVVLVAGNQTIQAYQQLKLLSGVAVIRNASFDETFDHDTQINKVDVASYDQAIKMLNANRVEAVVGSRVGLEYAIAQNAANQYSLANAFVLNEKEWWIHLSKKSALSSLKPQLKQVVDKLYRDDLVYRTYKVQLKKCQSLVKRMT